MVCASKKKLGSTPPMICSTIDDSYEAIIYLLRKNISIHLLSANRNSSADLLKYWVMGLIENLQVLVRFISVRPHQGPCNGD